MRPGLAARFQRWVMARRLRSSGLPSCLMDGSASLISCARAQLVADRIWISRENVGLAGVLQPDMFDVCRLRHYAQTSGRFRLPSRHRQAWRDVRVLVSRRGFARRGLIPRLCRKCTDARSGDTESPVDVASALRGAGFDAFCLIPRSYAVFASHGWANEHGCSD